MDDMFLRTPAGLETPAYAVLKRSKDWEVRRYEDFAVCSVVMSKGGQSQGTQGTDSQAPQGTGDNSQGTKGGAAGASFNTLAGYIFGKNADTERMSMTTPVISNSRNDRMSFVLPSRFWGPGGVGTAPIPVDPRVILEMGAGGASAVPSAVESGVSATGSEFGSEVSGSGVTGLVEGPVGPLGSTVAVLWFGGYASKGEVQRRAGVLRERVGVDGGWELVEGAEGEREMGVKAEATEGAEGDMGAYSVMQYNDPFVPPWKRRNEVAFPVRARAPMPSVPSIPSVPAPTSV
ncbi:SOUL heme-binding protein-domain-containing protein [Ochromonadaceae sp. CCMP2298]|nr:SOUL heme-binding protein-domain-containing protein [Ochromonadaceae sp. CCMP2298]